MFISDFGKSPVNLIESICEEFYAVRDQQGNPHIVGLPSGADAKAGREYLASNQYTVLTGPMESIDAVKLFFKKQLLEHAIAQIKKQLAESKQLPRYKRNRFKSLDQRRQEEEYLLRQAMLDVSNENKGSLEEIDRRGFLKGLGAAALAGATGMSVAGDLEDKIGPLPIMATIKIRLADGTTKTIKKDLGHAYDYRLDDAKKDLEDLLNRKGIKNYSIHLDRYKDNSAYLDRETKPAAADYVDRSPLKGGASDRASDYMDNKPYKSSKGDKTYMDPAESVEEAAKKGLYYNVNKRKKAGTSRPAGHPKAPTAQAWKDAAKTAKNESVAEGLEQQWVVTVGTKTGGTSHTMTFSGTKEQAIKKAVARFGTSKNPVVTAKPKEQGVAEGGIATVGWPDEGNHTGNNPPVSIGGTFSARPVVKKGSLVKVSGLTGVHRVMDIRGDQAYVVQEIPNSGGSNYVPMSDLRVWTNKPIAEFAPSGGDDGSNRNIDPLREKIFNMLMKKLSNVEADPSDLSDAAMEVADDIASESEFVDFKQLPMWVEMVLDKVQGVAEDQLDEKWSNKYKRSINCASPKGFSQRAHCAGRKKNESVTENAEELNIGDPVIITGDVEFNGKTGDIAEFGRDKRFVVVNLYNHGKHSFHSSDVEYNDYADQEDELNMEEGAGSMTVGMKSNHSAFKEEIDEAVERAAQSMAEDGYEFAEEKVRLDPKCWTGKKIGNPKTKMKGGVRVNNCVPK